MITCSMKYEYFQYFQYLLIFFFIKLYINFMCILLIYFILFLIPLEHLRIFAVGSKSPPQPIFGDYRRTWGQKIPPGRRLTRLVGWTGL